MTILAAVVFILYFTLFPWSIDWSLIGSIPPWTPFRTRADYVDCVVNVILFLPLGLASMRKGSGLVRGVLVTVAGGLLSFTVEVIQQGIPGRNSSMRDVLMNLIGTGAGAWLSVQWQANPASRSMWDEVRGILRGPSLSLLLLAAMWQAFPFMPSLRITKLADAWGAVKHPQWPWMEMVDVFLVAVVLAGAAVHLRSWRRFVPPLLLLALLCGQAIISDIVLSPARLIAAVAGLAGAAIYWRGQERWRYLALGIVLFLWLGIRELSPFRFSTMAARFEWVPFAAMLSDAAEPYVRTLAGKTLVYGATAWCLWRGGWTSISAAAAPMVLLAAGEWLQRYLPGRTPESTDVVMALIGFVLLRWTIGGDSLRSNEEPSPAGRPIDRA